MIGSETTELISTYEKALTAAGTRAPSSEKVYYDLHLRALDELKSLILSDTTYVEIFELLKAERRQFGWSYLSGDCGERVEKAFYDLFRDVEENL